MDAANILDGIPAMLPEEMVTVLHGREGLRVERIVSWGHASPPDFWYDQDEDEWVLLLEGSAAIEFEGQPEPVELCRGSYLNILAHARHRVAWTHPTERTMWLAVFRGG